MSKSKPPAAPEAPPDRRTRIVLVAENRRARHDFEILERFEAGLMLSGPEVKSLRAGHVQFEGAFVRLDEAGEAWLDRLHIGRFKQAAGGFVHLDERRERKLLLTAQEIHKLRSKYEAKGLAMIPLRVYFKGPWAKIEFGVGRGKTKGDKRETLKGRELTREAESAIKSRR